MLKDLGKSSFLKIFSALYWAAHLFFILVVAQNKILAADEGIYREDFQLLYIDGTLGSSIQGWESHNLIFFRLIYLPAKVLNEIGFNNLTSLRIESTICGYVSMLLLVSAFSKCRSNGLLFSCN